jgi:hypothetical protein
LLLAANKPGVAIQRDPCGSSVRAQGLDDCCEGRFGSEILAHLSIEEDRGAGIHCIEDFDDVLVFAVTLSRHGRDILEVELPSSHGSRALNRGMVTFPWDGDAAVLAEDLPDGAGGARQTEAKRLELRIMRQELQDGLRARDTLEMSRRGIADGEDALNDEGVKARRRPGTCARAAVQDTLIIGKGVAEAFAPFFDPGEGAMRGSSVVVEGPGGLEVEQGAEKRPVSEPRVFHGATSTKSSCG